jgi:thioredoxin 1
MYTTTMNTLTDETFDAVVSAGSGLVAVDVGAEWCGACKVLEPALQDVARELAGRVAFFAIDSDANPRTVTRFAVRALPTILVFRDGTLVDRIVGAQSRTVLRSRLDVPVQHAP